MPVRAVTGIGPGERLAGGATVTVDREVTMRTRRHRRAPGITVLAVIAASALACSPSTPTPTPTPTNPTAIATDHGPDATDLDGATVDVLGLWSGPEYDAFVTVKDAWEEATGAAVDWQGTQDLSAVLDSRIQAGDPPDIAILPNPGLVQDLADAGTLVPLDSFMDMDQVERDYAPAWIDLGSHGGRLYALFSKVTDKSTVWYSPSTFAAGGYTVPETWHDLIDLANRMVADGRTPFSIASASGAASGWPLTDLVSQLVLTGCGPALYDDWVAGEIPWTDPCIRRSFELFDAVVQTPGFVLGGVPGALATTDAEGADPVYSDPPAAAMYPMASFAQAFITARHPDLVAGQDYDYFTFPAVDPQYAGTIAIGADVIVMVTDTPAARSFMTYLAGVDAQQRWVELGGFTSVNQSVPPDAYPDPVARDVAEGLIAADVSRFSAGDMMPAALQRAWWGAMLDLAEDPSTLDATLVSLTEVARDAS